MSVKSRIHQKIAVIGLGTFGASLAKELTAAGIQVLAIDKSLRLVDEISDFVDHAVCLDSKDTEALEQNGIHRVDAAAVCIGDSFQETVMVTLKLLEMKVPRVLARAAGESEAQILNRIGAHEVMFIEKEMGKHWANLIARPGALEDFEVSRNYSIVRIHPHPNWVGRSLSELRLPKQHGLTVLGFYQEERFKLVEGPDSRLELSNDLLVIGHHQDIDRFFADRVKEEKSQKQKTQEAEDTSQGRS
ncbi:MAG: TrkA family potassium uptake protein [Bradymonadales bacterium]|nr:MAG: TrkA family potassium uptake protein [Bradymonadales bacterium]